ncbi:MAG: DUF4351 domain-containing protein [Sandaracinaceae bacterium]|nr:DUF4351 domain-containing protein [Sandaracinaceae bacterium]
MTRPHEAFGKDFLLGATEALAVAQAELEVGPEPQSIDLWLEPRAARPEAESSHPSIALLAHMTREPCGLELYSRAPGVPELYGCLRKQLGVAHLRARAQRTTIERALPPFWVLCAGRPRRALDALGAAPLEGDFPAGFFGIAVRIPLRLVVLSELPETPETRILRLLGRRRVFSRALAEVKDDPLLWPILEPVALRWATRIEHRGASSPEEEELLMNTREYFEAYSEKLRQEGRTVGLRQGRQEGRRELLAALLAQRFGPLPDAARARLEVASEETLARIGAALFDAPSLEALFAEE